MAVGTWTDPDNETQLGNQLKGNYDNDLMVGKRIVRRFAPHEATPPDLTVALDPGQIFDGQTLTEIAQQIAGPVVAPIANPRIDRVVVNASTGAAAIITGAEDPAPVPPALSPGLLPVCQVLLQIGQVSITNQNLTDERTAAGAGGGGLNPGSPVELTIDNGAVTVTGDYHTLRNEAGAGSDDLDTIDASALSEGALLILAAGDAGEVPTVKDGTGNVTMAGGDFVGDSLDKRLVLQVVAPGDLVEVARSSASAGLFIARDEKSSGTNGGSGVPTTWTPRTLNTVVENTIPGASLGSNQVTMPAGKYLVRARAPTIRVGYQKIALYNVTDAVFEIIGSSTYNSWSGDYAGTDSEIFGGILTLAASKVLELRYYINQAPGGNDALGWATGSGQVEVYAEIYFERIG